MKKIYLISAIAAILCGLLVFRYVGSVNAELERAKEAQKLEMTRVVVAAKDIPAFTVITDEMLATREYPTAYLHEATATNKADVTGKMANGTIVKDEIILTNAIGSLADITETLAGDIPDGKRAMTISVSNDSGVGGYITEGDFVDVMVFISASETKTGLKATDGSKVDLSAAITKTVIQGAEVLRTGNSDTGEGVIYPSLTLALTPEECETLFTAQQTGSLYAVLRQTNDTSEIQTGNHSLSGLMNQ